MSSRSATLEQLEVFANTADTQNLRAGMEYTETNLDSQVRGSQYQYSYSAFHASCLSSQRYVDHTPTEISIQSPQKAIISFSIPS
jgi:hypothetical protein